MKEINFLDRIGDKLRKKENKYLVELNYSVKIFGTVTHFLLQTQGCKYTKNGYGGCVMCNYNYKNKIASKDLIRYAQKGIQEINNATSVLLLNSSGNFLDSQEIPREVRLVIYNSIKSFDNLRVVFETLLETINQDKLIEMKDILNKHNIDIEFGLESTNRNILKYSLNKSINLSDIRNKVELIHSYGINTVANVLVGAPFLSEKEIINDAIQTIKDSFAQKISYIVLFPLTIKPNTIVSWMYKHKLYDKLSLWTYIEVLNRIDEKYLNRIELSWYKENLFQGFETPTTCSKCKKYVVDLLDEYAASRKKRIQAINKLNKVNCKCKISWRNAIKDNCNFKGDIINSYEILGKSLIPDYWTKNSNRILEKLNNTLNSHP